MNRLCQVCFGALPGCVVCAGTDPWEGGGDNCEFIESRGGLAAKYGIEIPPIPGEETMKDTKMVERPEYYNRGKIEVLDFIEDQRLPYSRGCIVKYVCRAGFKSFDKELEDLEKAAVYLRYEIELAKARREKREPRKNVELANSTNEVRSASFPQSECIVERAVNSPTQAFELATRFTSKGDWLCVRTPNGSPVVAFVPNANEQFGGSMLGRSGLIHGVLNFNTNERKL